MSGEIKVFVDETACCPRCGNDVIDEHAPNGWPGELRQDCQCRECGYEWVDVYRYSHSTAERLPESEEDEVKWRVFEMSRWPLPMFPHPASPDEVVVMDTFSNCGELLHANFTVNGLGYAIDFANHGWSRNTGYDEKED